MATIADQVTAARSGAQAASALETKARQQVASLFDDWAAGKINNRAIRHRLEGVVRAAYRSTGALAREQTKRASELAEWEPAEATFKTEYLADLLSDVRRNLSDFTKVRSRASTTSDDLEAARRRARLRIQHSAGVAASRGHTDGLIEAHAELEDFGFRLIKIWTANFEDNTPCPYCGALHGSQAALRGTFHVEIKLKVYRNLQGPPRHPQCQCFLTILIITLENAMEKINIDRPGLPRDSSNASAVRNLPLAIFTSIIAVLRAVIRFSRGK